MLNYTFIYILMTTDNTTDMPHLKNTVITSFWTQTFYTY